MLTEPISYSRRCTWPQPDRALYIRSAFWLVESGFQKYLPWVSSSGLGVSGNRLIILVTDYYIHGIGT